MKSINSIEETQCKNDIKNLSNTDPDEEWENMDEEQQEGWYKKDEEKLELIPELPLSDEYEYATITEKIIEEEERYPDENNEEAEEDLTVEGVNENFEVQEKNDDDSLEVNIDSDSEGNNHQQSYIEMPPKSG